MPIGEPMALPLPEWITPSPPASDTQHEDAETSRHEDAICEHVAKLRIHAVHLNARVARPSFQPE